MQTGLERLERLLDMTFSEVFHDFWKAHVPDKTPSFRIRRGKLDGEFGNRGYDPETGWLIQLEESLPPSTCEVTLAHEITHLVLDYEGYPMLAPGKQWIPQVVAADLHAVLTHPVVWFRLREWSFPVDDHIQGKARGRLESLQAVIDQYPGRDEFPWWQDWLLRYVLARLEWGEPERQEIFDIFLKRRIHLGSHGENCIERLRTMGYFEPKKLTPAIVIQAGVMLLERLRLEDYFNLVSIKPFTRP